MDELLNLGLMFDIGSAAAVTKALAGTVGMVLKGYGAFKLLRTVLDETTRTITRGLVKGIGSFGKAALGTFTKIAKVPLVMLLNMIVKIVSALKDMVSAVYDAGREYEKRFVKLANRFGSEAYSEKINAWQNDALQKYPVLRDELNEYVTSLDKFGIPPDLVNLEGVIEAGLGPLGDFNTALSEMQNLAMNPGSIRSFQEATNFTISQEAINQSLNGLESFEERMIAISELYANTYAGGIERSNSTIDGSFRRIRKVASQFFEDMAGNAFEEGTFMYELRVLLKDIADLVEENKKDLIIFAKTTSRVFGAAIKAIRTAVGPLFKILQRLMDRFSDSFDEIEKKGLMVQLLFSFVGKAMKRAFEQPLQTLANLRDSFTEGILNFDAASAIDSIKTGLANVRSYISNFFKSGEGGMSPVENFLFGFLNNARQIGLSIRLFFLKLVNEIDFAALGNAMLQNFITVFNGVVGVINKAATALGLEDFQIDKSDIKVDVFKGNTQGALDKTIKGLEDEIRLLRDVNQLREQNALMIEAQRANMDRLVDIQEQEGGVEKFIRDAITKQGIENKAFADYIVETARLESAGFKKLYESSYANTSNDRIRSKFSAVSGLSDEELTALKKDDKKFFNTIYNGIIGNNQEGDGYRYRGRGLVQLTGRENYEKFSKILGQDLVNNPELAADPQIAAQILIKGMAEGLFTKNKLSDFLSDGGSFDAVGARAIVNPRDLEGGALIASRFNANNVQSATPAGDKIEVNLSVSADGLTEEEATRVAKKAVTDGLAEAEKQKKRNRVKAGYATTG